MKDIIQMKFMWQLKAIFIEYGYGLYVASYAVYAIVYGTLFIAVRNDIFCVINLCDVSICSRHSKWNLMYDIGCNVVSLGAGCQLSVGNKFVFCCKGLSLVSKR